MKKGVKIIIIIGIILAILAAIGFFGYRFAEDYALKMFMKRELNNMLDSGAVSLETLEETFAPTVEEVAPGEIPPEEAPSGEPSEEAPSEAPEAKPETKPQSKPKTREEIINRAVEKVESSISRSERNEMASLIRSKLSASDISYLLGLMSGGLTPDERNAALKIALSRFSKEEVKRVQSFYHKYLSVSGQTDATLGS